MATAIEPAWLAGAREAAAATYESLPVPSNREEAWRFTNLRGFDPDSFSLQPGTLTIEGDQAGGVTFGSLARLAAERPELVEPHLGTVVSGEEKFAAGNAARWQDGILLHVPAGVAVETPLRATLELAGDGTAAYHRVLVVLEAGAQATFTEEFVSAVPGYVNVVVELKVADGARLEYVTIQNHHPETRQFGTHRATVGRDAELDWVAAAMGGTRAKSRMESYLAARGATVKVTGAYYLTGMEHVDYDTTQEHGAPDTTSDLAFKGVLDDRARAVWRGVIRVDKGAQKTDAYQENRNLLLSTDAQATPIPGLEIEANDVRCTHGATVGQVDAGHLFYLMSRGLSRAEAQRAIVRGFFEPVLDRIGSQPVRDSLAAALDARIR
ncbi:MAG TPA: Fe-S cluster assembly protein SufD [Gaiellales bacterium]|jgi:Fe-S cluster assembly protein SufD|nr:Fe-S cluster assembly protein SufD [Gaiellales bacterium]